jgi:ribA/ribD-fused uncharacterized protein
MTVITVQTIFIFTKSKTMENNLTRFYTAVLDWSKFRPEHFNYEGKWIKNWFSNMTPCLITVGGIKYNSVENYYQAMKYQKPDDWKLIGALSPMQAKRMARRTARLPSNWDTIKYTFMHEGLTAKFTQHKNWYDMLLHTGDDVLVEWNNWNDRIWGVSITDNIGCNALGLILMEVRKEIK